MNHVTALRISLYDCIDKPPRDYINPIKPDNAINFAWIPQTMGDQVWCLWEFATEQEKQDFEKSLPDDVSRWLDANLPEIAARYGWHSRNENGFLRY